MRNLAEKRATIKPSEPLAENEEARYVRETVDLAASAGRGLPALALAADHVRELLNVNRLGSKVPVAARSGVATHLDEAAEQAHAHARDTGDRFDVDVACTLRALEWLLVTRDHDQIKAFGEAARDYFDRNPDLPRPFAASKGSGDEQLLALVQKCHRSGANKEQIAGILFAAYPKLRPGVVESGGQIRHKDRQVTEADLVKALDKVGRRKDADDDEVTCRAVVRVIEGPQAAKNFLTARDNRTRRADRKF